MAFLFTKLFARFSNRARMLTGGDPGAVKLYSDRVLATPVESLLDPSLYARAADPDVIDLNQSAPRFESPVSAGRLIAEVEMVPAQPVTRIAVVLALRDARPSGVRRAA